MFVLIHVTLAVIMSINHVEYNANIGHLLINLKWVISPCSLACKYKTWNLIQSPYHLNLQRSYRIIESCIIITGSRIAHVVTSSVCSVRIWWFESYLGSETWIASLGSLLSNVQVVVYDRWQMGVSSAPITKIKSHIHVMKPLSLCA